jgi:exonuclease SbcC
MLKLRKLYIDNFKGIDEPKILDLENCSFAILSGPNGFGKTTIFDVVELCLSGKLQRTDSFSNITKNNTDYKKPFYQHSKGRDVILKLLLQDDTDESYHVIVKYLDKDHDGKRHGQGRSFKPDAWEILSTYYSSEPATFERQFVIGDYRESNQAFIDGLFFGTAQLSHKNLYPLFNYLQQEENIYFLKKDEEQKKSELDFLFQTQLQGQQLDEITHTHRKIKELTEELKGRIERLGSIANELSNSTYNQLFPGKPIAYDQQELFAGKSPDEILEGYNTYIRDIDILAEFIRSFDIVEYRKDKAREGMTYILRERPILSAFVLFNFTTPERFAALENLSRQRRNATERINDLENETINEQGLQKLGFPVEFIDGYKEVLAEKTGVLASMDEIGRIISDLIEARQKVILHSSRLPDEVHQSQNCPLCNTDWQTSEEFIESVRVKTEALQGFNARNIERIGTLNARIEQTYKSQIRNIATIFLDDPENELEDGFFQYISQTQGYRERIDRFRALLVPTSIDFNDHILTAPVSSSLLQEKVDDLVKAIQAKIAETIPDQTKIIHKHLFKELFSEDSSQLVSIEEVNSKKEYTKSKYDQARHFSLQILNTRLGKFQSLERKIGEVKDELSKAIKDYKREMIEKIKIPFYLFSGKILQNYQQGFGIFIEMQPTTARVRFLTDSNSDHDVVHHLSSGQLAVVSIAFCLSLNKVYRTSRHFKFLAVDDPVQTLDDINVHALIELMRHEFSDYQIMLSTHESDIERYLHYKFSNFGFTCERINVQEEFFGTEAVN